MDIVPPQANFPKGFRDLLVVHEGYKRPNMPFDVYEGCIARQWVKVTPEIDVGRRLFHIRHVGTDLIHGHTLPSYGLRVAAPVLFFGGHFHVSAHLFEQGCVGVCVWPSPLGPLLAAYMD